MLEGDYGQDKIKVTEFAIYLYIPGDASRTKLNNAFIERKLKINTTTRNYNTLSKLILMSEE